MKRLLVISTVLAALCSTPTAQALRGSGLMHGVSAVEVAQFSSVVFWKNNPCGGSVQVQYTPPSQGPDPAVATGLSGTKVLWAWVTFNTPDGPTNFNSPPSTYTDCVVHINPQIWSPVMQSWLFLSFCALMVHEYGHLEGYADQTAVPTSITYPLISPQNESVWPCTYFADYGW